MKRVTNGFDRLNEPNFSVETGHIISCIKGNSYFPGQQSLITAIETLYTNNYLPAVTNASTGDKVAIAIRSNIRLEVTKLLHQLGTDVTAVAKGDIVILISSGMSYTKNKENNPPFITPASLRTFAGANDGSILCKAKKQKGTISVVYSITSDPANADSWKSYTSTKSKYLFTNLESGVRYWMKYELIGARDQRVESGTTSYVTQ